MTTGGPVWWGLGGRFTLCEDSVLAHPGRVARTNVNVLFHWKSLWIIQSLFFFTWKATHFCIHMCKRWLSLGHRTTQWQFLGVFSPRSWDGVISQRCVPVIADNRASFVSPGTTLPSSGKRRQRMASFTYVNRKMVLKQCPVKDNVLFPVYFIYFKKFLTQFLDFNRGKGGTMAVLPPPCPLCPTRAQSALFGDIFWLLGLGFLLGSSRKKPGVQLNMLQCSEQTFPTKNYPTTVLTGQDWESQA